MFLMRSPLVLVVWLQEANHVAKMGLLQIIVQFVTRVTVHLFILLARLFSTLQSEPMKRPGAIESERLWRTVELQGILIVACWVVGRTLVQLLRN